MELPLFHPQMKNKILFLALLAVSGSAAANEITRALAERPMGLVQDNTCHVRGAVWADGPRANVEVALIDVVSAQTYTAITDEAGVYRVEIPYSKPAVYQERLIDGVVAPVELLPNIRIHEGGVVCDHRLLPLSTARLSQ